MNLMYKLRGWRKSARLAWERWRHAFDRQDLLSVLRSVGVRSGDVIMVHSAIDRFAAFKGTPTDIIETLKAAVGEDGAVLMPTIPFTRTAVEYAKTAPVFDVMRTPSRVGLLTELFRRSDGVVRSVHPTHPVAAWGRDSLRLVEGHEFAGSPCGAGSPYEKLLDLDGKIVFLGVPIDVLTFFHTIEARLEPTMPFSPFTSEVYEFRCRGIDGAEVVVRSRLFDPAVSRRRTMAPLDAELKRSGAWRSGRVGNVAVIAISARAAMAAARRLADRGVYCYE